MRELNCDYNRSIGYPMQTFASLINSVTRKHGRPILTKSDLAGSMILMEQFMFGPRGCVIKWTVREWTRRRCCEESMIRSAARNAYLKLSTSTHVHGVGNCRTRQNTWLITFSVSSPLTP